MRYTAYIVLPLLFITFLFPTYGAFAASLGNGYSCDGGELKRKGKDVTKKAALSDLNSKISTNAALVKKYGKKTKKGKHYAAVVASLKATKKSLDTCKPVPTIIKQMAKEYSTGAWHNTTYDVTGALSANMTLNGTVLEVSITIGGDMFGSLHPGPVLVSKDMAGATFPVQITATGTTIGDLVITIQSNGNLAVDETVVPSLPGILTAHLDAVFDPATGYTGTFTSTLVGGAQLAAGTIVLSN